MPPGSIRLPARYHAPAPTGPIGRTMMESEQGKRLLLCPADAADLRDLARQLGHYGFRCELFDTPAALVAAAARVPAQGVLLDCSRLPQTAPEREALRALAERTPIACVADDGSIEARLAAVRLGCRAYFLRPLELGSLLDGMDRLCAPPRAETGRVLIIDDSRALATLYAAHLSQAGCQCEVVTDPLRTLDALHENPPDLILLDMNMPAASGQEIAQIIRQQDAFLSIPIVFLSAETDVTRQREAMSLGGDEFLQKPIEPVHLISAVKTRVLRYRALRSLMVRDSLTGLLNHTTFKERLRAETARAVRQGNPLAVALIDLDHFKQVNDRYGHPAGDRVIKNLARLLRQRLRGADVVGRYGGEEFAVALPDTALDNAVAVLDQLRTAFAGIDQGSGSGRFHVTCSIGVTQCPPVNDGEALIAAADTALYEAKREGRNQVRCVAATTPLKAVGKAGGADDGSGAHPTPDAHNR